MPFYSYAILILFIILIFLVVLFYFSKKKNTSELLYMEGVREENLGHLKLAVIAYKKALLQTDHFRFQATLKSKIINKIKVLQTVIKYEASFHRTD
jgi:PDZ domain-containing secreted protein